MKTFALLTIGLSLSSSVACFAAAPDLSKLSSIEVLKLGLANVEHLEGRCYSVKHDFCEVGSDPRNCSEDDVLEQKTIARLNDMKFVLGSRTLDEKKQEVLVYKAVPISPKLKEADLYTLRGTKKSSPIRFFVTLREASCTLQTPEPAKKTTEPKVRASVENSAPTTAPKHTMPSEGVIAIQPNSKRDNERALRFLTNIPMKSDAKVGN